MKTASDHVPIMTQRAVDVALRRYLDARAAGQRLAWAREACGISQRELGAYIGCSAATIRRIEHGARTMTLVERACAARALGCSIVTLGMPAVPPGPAASNGNGSSF